MWKSHTCFIQVEIICPVTWQSNNKSSNLRNLAWKLRNQKAIAFSSTNLSGNFEFQKAFHSDLETLSTSLKIEKRSEKIKKTCFYKKQVNSEGSFGSNP